MENKFVLNRTIKIIVLLALAVLSFFYLGNMMSKPETYGQIIEILDEKKASVLGLTATTSAASISITMIPDDIGTPVADQLADLSAYLLIILTVIYLEKYLLTIIGIATFKVILPIAFLLWIFYLLFPQNFSLKKVVIKLLIFGLAMFLVIPVSVYVSKTIDNTYEESIKETLSLANEEIKIEEEAPKEELPWYEQILHSFNNVIDDVKNTISK